MVTVSSPLVLVISLFGVVSARATTSVPSLLVTEVLAHDASSGAESYWELTNFSATAVAIGGWSWDDDSETAGTVPIPLNSTIGAGESVVFTATDSATFRALWNFAEGVQIFSDETAPQLGENDGVNLYNSEGVLMASLSYEAAGFSLPDGSPAIGGAAAGGTGEQAVVWEPSSGADDPCYTLATGTNYGTSLAEGRAGSPGRLGEEIDLSQYVRIGRYDLPEPTRTDAPAGNLLAAEASAVTYNWDTDTLFVTGDGGQSVTQVSKTGEFIDTMTLGLGSSAQGTDFYDPEGLTYLGNGEFVLCEERDRQLVKFTYVAGATLTRAETQTVKLGTFDNNTGIEGASYDPMTGGFIALKEKNPIGVFHTEVDFANGTSSNGDATAENSENLFDTDLLGMDDVADVFALSNLTQQYSGNLLVLGQENARIVNIDRSGTISSTLQVTSDLGNPLSAADQQHEGLTMDREGVLYVVNENGGGDITRPQLWVYAPATEPNTAPESVELVNELSEVPENIYLFAPFKIGDLIVADDGLGFNALTVTGADAEAFEVVDSALYLKAGVTVDYETQSQYSLVIEVDDVSVGCSPDATLALTLFVTDIEPETARGPAVLVSETAPWSSGNSAVGKDWFELTNNTNVEIDLTGWQMDDNSAALANAVDLTGVSVIAPGESVVFIDSSDLATDAGLFITEWFGGVAPTGFQMGAYDGPGLGTGGDGVYLFDGNGLLVASFDFEASPEEVPFQTFDNSAGVPTGERLSEVGVYGAFLASNGREIGSPGTTGAVIVSEVAPRASSQSQLECDWFELTNLTGRVLDLTSWTMDDESESATTAVPLYGVTSIAPGESVIFVDTDDEADLAEKAARFRALWFGSEAPMGLQIGGYSGPGLSTDGDAVNLFSGLTRRARGIFGDSPAAAPYGTFDNIGGEDALAMTLLSVVGANGAFAAAGDINEVGSPGLFTASPASVGVSLADFAAQHELDPTADETLMAYAYGILPNQHQRLELNGVGQLMARGRESLQVESSVDSLSLSLTFLRRGNAASQGLTYLPQYSADLAIWHDVTDAPELLSVSDEVEVVRSTLPPLTPDQQPARFFRIQVQAGPVE